MTKIQITKKIGFAFFLTATALGAGGVFAQSLQDDATADADSISATSSDLTAEAARPKAALPTLRWTTPVGYDTGIKTKIAIRNGFIVEVHKSQSTWSNAIWYHIGKLDHDGGTVTWGASHKLGYEGDWPAVALSKEGYVIFTWSTYYNTDGSDLAYRVGTVNLNGDVNQTIDFKKKGEIYDTGYHGSISINRQGVIAEAHEGGRSLFYRLGHLTNPSAGDLTITWDTGKKGVKYDSGVDPQVSINDSYQLVDVHGVRNESLLHYIRASVHSNIIDFSSDHPRYDNNAIRPGVVLRDDGALVEVHQSGTKAHYRTGELAANSALITWSAGEPIYPSKLLVFGYSPAVASDGNDVIATWADEENALIYAVATLP
jgi:hypothetical protein